MNRGFELSGEIGASDNEESVVNADVEPEAAPRAASEMQNGANETGGSLLRPALSAAEGINAERISFARHVSHELGIPESWVLNGDAARMERELAARRIESKRYLRQWAQEHPWNAALARDDTEALGRLSETLATPSPEVRRAEYDLEAGALSALAGPYAGMDEDAEKGMNRQILAASSGFWGGVARPLAASAQAAAENLYGENSMPAWLAGEVKAWIESVTPKFPEEGDSFGQYWLDAAAFVQQLAGQLGAGAIGGPLAAGAFGGATQFGSIYADLRDKGVSPQASASSAGLGASVNAVLDSVGTGSLLDMFKSKGARDALVKGLAAFGIEPLTEFIQAFPENFATLWGESELHGDSAYDRLSWFAENFFNAENLGSTAEKGAYEASFALLFGGVGGAGKFMSELSSVAWTKRQRRVHDALAASKLGKEHPELAAAALEEMDPEMGRLVSIPADKALELLQRGTDIMTPLGFDAESAARHAAMGRSLDVRLSDVHTRLDAAGYDAVERIMVPGPRGVSLSEIEDVTDEEREHEAAEAARVYDEYAREQSEYDAAATRLRADVESAVAASPNLAAQAQSMAGGVKAYVDTMLEPVEGFARRMEAIGVPRAETLGRIRPDLDAVAREWEARELEAAKREAGLSPLVRHIRGRLDGKSLKRDFPGVYRELRDIYGPGLFGKNGLAVDLLADELVTAGLLEPGSGANELVERLRNGERGLFQVSEEDVRLAEKKLAEDVKAWEKTVDGFMAGTLNERKPVTMLNNTPLVLTLFGTDKNLQVATNYTKLTKILKDKHKLSESVLKQVPSAMTDPVMIFDSATVKGDYVMMLDLKDENGATIIVPLSLNYDDLGGYTVNYVPSVYAKANTETTKPNNAWFIRQVGENRLRYINHKKSREWVTSSGLQLPRVGSRPSNGKNRIFTETDLVKLKNAYPGYYQTAYHGTPHRFDEFSLDAIGTGEGAQAHGWGLYFAGDRKVSEGYKNRLTDRFSFSYKGVKGEHLKPSSEETQAIRAVLKDFYDGKASDLAEAYNGQIQEQEKILADEHAAEWQKNMASDRLAALKDIDINQLIVNTGQLFEVDIPENDVLLDEQKTLEEQPHIAKLLDEYAEKIGDWSFSAIEAFPEDWTGREIYRFLSEHLGSSRAASEYLNAAGIKGITYEGGQDGRCFVVFDDKAIDVLNTFYQGRGMAEARGSVVPVSEGYLVSLFSRANLSTLPHELGHIFRMEMQRAVDMGLADEAMLKDHQTFEKWLSRFDDNATLEAEYNERLKNNPTFKDRAFSSLSPEEIVQVRETAKHEYFARGFEAYLREGKAPSKGLEGAFQRFRKWLMAIYRSAKKLGVELNDDVREAFDNILTTEREMNAEAARNELLSLDEKQLDTLGLSGVEREDAAGLMKKAVQIAIRERIRDQRQNRRAKWREYERQAREELLKEPVYKALEGALNRPMDFDAVREAIGEKDADALLERHAGIMDENGTGDPEFLAFRSKAVIVRGNELGVPEGADIREYIAAAKKYHDALKYESEHGKPVVQPQLKRSVRFSGKGWRKNLSNGANPEKWMMFPKLREIIESSTLIHSEKVNKPRKDGFTCFHWVENQVEISGNPRRVGLMLAEDRDGNLFYNLNADVEAWEQKRSGSSNLPAQSMAGESEPLFQDDGPSLDENISNDFDNVNLHILPEQDPELLAREHGYKRAAAMLSDMLNAEPLDKAIRKRAGTIANQAEARLFKPEDYLVASEAIQKQANLIAARLSEKAGEQKIVDKVFETVANREMSAMPMDRAVNTQRFLADLRRALRQERHALRSGDVKAALKANNKVRLNLEFARQSQRARKLQESAQSDISRFLKNRSANADARFIVMNIAMNHGLARYNEALARGRDDHSIAEWFKDMEDKGYEFYFEPETVFSNTRSWRDMTFAGFVSMNDGLRQVMFADRNERKVLSIADKRSVAEIASELATQARREYKTRPERRVEKERLDTPKKWLRTLHAQLMKVEFICNMLDGGEHGGIWERTIFRPIADAEAKRDLRLKKEVARMRSEELFGRYDAAALRQKELVKTVGEAFTLEQRLMVALNMGNEGNYERLKAGFGWTDEQLADIVSSLSKEDWDFVTNVWKYLESFRKEAFAVERTLTGIEPKAVEARPFMTPHGEVPGGYFPVAYDPEKGAKAFERAQKTDDKKLLGGRNYGGAQTAHGHLKARAKAGTGEALDLSFSVIGNHVFDVVHDFTFRIPVMDVAKILRNKEVQTALNETVGPEMARLFMPWLQDVSMMRRDPSSLWEKSLSKARALTTVYGLGYKLTVLVQQGTGYLQTIDAIGLRHTARGVARVFENADRLKDFFNETCELSPFMATRMESFDRDIKDIDRRIVPQKGAAHAARAARDWSMKCIGLCQMGVDLGTWWGAYEKRMRETRGDMTESVAYADSIVRMTQGGGGTKDLSRVQRGSEATKLLTMFYSFFNVQYNLWARRAHLTKSARDVPKAMNTVFLTAILGPILSEILAGRGPDDDDDESWLGWGAKNVITYPFMTIPGVRDMVNGIAGDYGYRMTPLEQTFKRVVRLADAVKDAATGEEDWSRAGREAVEIGGILSNGLITQQMVTTGLGLVRFLEGDDFELADLARRRKRGQ